MRLRIPRWVALLLAAACRDASGPDASSEPFLSFRYSGDITGRFAVSGASSAGGGGVVIMHDTTNHLVLITGVQPVGSNRFAVVQLWLGPTTTTGSFPVCDLYGGTACSRGAFFVFAPQATGTAQDWDATFYYAGRSGTVELTRLDRDRIEVRFAVEAAYFDSNGLNPNRRLSVSEGRGGASPTFQDLD